MSNETSLGDFKFNKRKYYLFATFDPDSHHVEFVRVCYGGDEQFHIRPNEAATPLQVRAIQLASTQSGHVSWDGDEVIDEEDSIDRIAAE